MLQDHGPDDFSVQQIAKRAGLSRTVLYRHFVDRGDLDRAVQDEIFDRVFSVLMEELRLEGTVHEIVHRILSAYVEWAVAHPTWHSFATRAEPGAEPSPMERALAGLAEQVETLMMMAADLLGAKLTEAEREGLDPLTFGLIGAAVSTVARWLTVRDRMQHLHAQQLVSVATEAIVVQISGMAAARGLDLPTDARVEDLVAAAVDKRMGEQA